MDCNEAKNAEQCIKFCPKLDDKMYYAFLDNRCEPNYKECKDVPIPGDMYCVDNVPEANYNCVRVGTECKPEPKSCDYFLQLKSRDDFCFESGDFCLRQSDFYTDICMKKEIRFCDEITYSRFPNINERLCNLFTVEDSSKICSLSDDGTECEEREKPVVVIPTQEKEDNTQNISQEETTQAITNHTSNETTNDTTHIHDTATPENTQSQGSASGLRICGIRLIIALISLLI